MIEESAKGVGKLKLNILLIEDNPEDQYTVRRMLRAAPHVDYELQVVENRSEALDALVNDFDVCLMDYELGCYTGLELLEQIQANDLCGPVILLTGHDEFSIDHSASQMGVSDFIAKSEVRTALLDRSIRYARRRFIDQRQLNHMAHHDALTGLLNRHAFLQQLETWLRSDAHSPSEIYLFYIDLDGFKAVNDTWGHDVGDQVLRNAALCIRNSVRAYDLVARYGGDELVAATAHVDKAGLESITKKLFSNLRKPLEIDGRLITVTASIGIARAHHAPDDAGELIRLADHAMFAAKHAGRDTSRLYTSDIPLAQRDRAAMESDLRTALQHGELFLTFQPHVNMLTGQITGAEALARWTHPERGPISPAQFIPLAEECGLIRPLTTWSLETALAALAQWHKDFNLPDGFRLGINVSPPQLLDPEFSGQLDALITKHQVNRNMLRLEITENFFIHENAISSLENITRDGLSLALDDFGTGFSSLSMLTQLPIDTMKIDRSFVMRMEHDKRAVVLIRSLIALGNAMQLEIIAEGVETESQQNSLLNYGCIHAQGFLYAYPENKDALARRLAAGTAITSSPDAE